MTRPRMDPQHSQSFEKIQEQGVRTNPHAGGPARGLFLLLTAPAKDLVIPGADYSFGQLQLALTRGNFESLGRQRRPVIRLHLVRVNNVLGKSQFAAPQVGISSRCTFSLID